MIPIEKQRKTIVAISEAIPDGKDQSSLNRFLTKGKWEAERVNTARIRVFIGNTPGYLVIDDTLNTHEGRKMEGTGSFKNHCNNEYVWAHQVVNTIHVTEEMAIEPVYPVVYLKPEDAEKLGMKFQTKIDIAREKLKWANQLLNLKGVLFDSWYLSKDIIKDCQQLQLHWYSELKSNRLVWHPRGGWQHVSKFACQYPRKEFNERETLDNLPSYTHFAEEDVYLKKGFHIKLVILWNGKNGSKAEYKYLATDDLKIDGSEFIFLWRLRWCIEEFHRDGKENLGLDEYQMRKIRGVVIHLLLVYLGYSFLNWFLHHSEKFFGEVLRTIGQTSRSLKEGLMYRLAWLRRRFKKRSCSQTHNTCSA